MDKTIVFKCNSDTVIIVLHEIYGINNHIRNFCEMLANEKNDVICPNLLLSNQSFSLEEEVIAYNNFIQNIGFNFAQQQVENLSLEIRNDYKYRFIIGYSIGATLAWLCSQREGLYNGIVGFYGSRIRDYKDIVPKCPTLLFFPRKEETFDINSLTQELSTKEDISIVQVNALHGFADPWSSKYCSEVSEETIRVTIDFMNRQRQ
jgi:dienelactone hydrolase